MSEQEKSQEYGQARAAFDSLRMDERAAFLVESVVSMLAEGVGEAGRVVSEVIDEMAQNFDSCCEDEPAAAQSKEAADSASAAKPKSGSAAGTKKAPAKPSARRSAGSAQPKK